jgi:hypothetical protein
VSRYCRRCRLLIPAGEVAVVVSTQEAGSGAPVAGYAHEVCPPKDGPEQVAAAHTPPQPPVGFRR